MFLLHFDPRILAHKMVAYFGSDEVTGLRAQAALQSALKLKNHYENQPGTPSSAAQLAGTLALGTAL